MIASTTRPFISTLVLVFFAACTGGGTGTGTLDAGVNAALSESNIPSSKAVKVAVGADFSCALTTTGIVACWGYSERGEIGSVITGEAQQFHHLVRAPTQVEGLGAGVTDFDANSHHGCAVEADRTVSCWGYNGSGELGDGTTTNRQTAVKVAGLADAKAVHAGCDFTCALTTGGAVKCWGDNTVYQLGAMTHLTRNPNSGIDFPDPSPTPIEATGLSSGVVALETGCAHACAILQDGSVRCWGNNANGEAGQPNTGSGNWGPPVEQPTAVAGLSGVTALSSAFIHDGSTGDTSSSCALTAGAMKCWGSVQNGLLGNGIDGVGTFVSQPTPSVVTRLGSGVTAIGGTCGVAGGEVRCWLSNLGDGTDHNSTKPDSKVTGISDAVQVSARGGRHACAVTKSGAIKCWGDNTFGTLGDGHDSQIASPIEAEGTSRVPVSVVNFP